MIVALTLRRNTKITSTTRAIANSSSNSTSEIEDLIPVVRSVSVVTCTPLGRLTCSCGNNCLMLLTTLMVLAPDWRCTFTMTAGVWFIQAAWLVFSIPSMTLATSVSITGAPLR